jgi:hypothetical protein
MPLVGRVVGLLAVCLSLASCGGISGTPAPSSSPTPDVAKQYLAAAEKGNKISDLAYKDLAAAVTEFRADKLTEAALLDRIHADYRKVAEQDDAFVADLLRIRFPDKMHADVVDLVKQVSAHRDVCMALAAVQNGLDFSSLRKKEDEVGTAVSAAVDVVRADLGLPRAPHIGPSP